MKFKSTSALAEVLFLVKYAEVRTYGFKIKVLEICAPFFSVFRAFPIADGI